MSELIKVKTEVMDLIPTKSKTLSLVFWQKKSDFSWRPREAGVCLVGGGGKSLVFEISTKVNYYLILCGAKLELSIWSCIIK